ncbi:hypothetical protein FQA39_LY11204 [Lamprigera yunnana]|nr:hypothetical protein FQA39_LY11204 [Lamprigera yunnana]
MSSPSETESLIVRKEVNVKTYGTTSVNVNIEHASLQYESTITPHLSHLQYTIEVKQVAGIYKSNKTGIVYTKDEKIIKDNKERINICEEYVTDLLENKRPEQPPVLNCLDNLTITID